MSFPDDVDCGLEERGMTQQVRTGYRRHRKATWGLALLLAAGIAAIAIPFAGGATSKELRFTPTGQPASFWQKGTTTTPFSVAVYSGGANPISSGPPPTPTVVATGAGPTDFSFGNASYDPGTKTWSWPNAQANAGAPSGLYRLVVTLGTLTATSNQFRVSDFVCPPGGGPSCNGTSNLGPKGQGKLNISNTIGTTIALDFQSGGGVCGDPSDPYQWNPATYTDSSGTPVHFPTIVLNYTPGSTMLQITYMIRNAEWVLSTPAQGNNDAEFCVGANRPFNGKYGAAKLYGGLYWGVLNTVPNASKVTTDPVVCARGTVDLQTGPNNTFETWRTWTHCIPAGVDYTGKVG
jgi:hypothetical protein